MTRSRPPLTVSKKLHTQVAAFTPVDDRDFHRQRCGPLRNGNPEREKGSGIEAEVAPHPAAGGLQVQQDSFAGAGIALDIRGAAKGDSCATA